MTDLTSIWSERMTRQAILNRADETDATIDPSEDAEQFKMLLQKIRDALQNAPGSTATLLQHHGSTTDTSSLELVTTTKLPAPLEPLKWSLRLAKEPPSATTTKLLFPLVEAEVSRASRQQTLIDQLSKKDWVLGKLFDKIEAVGIDLSTIFPGISGLRAGTGSRKGTTLAQAAKYVKGVAPFDEQAWLEEFQKLSPDADLASNIYAEVSGSEETKLRPPPDAWWEDLSAAESDYPRLRSPIRHDSPKPEPKPSKSDVDMDTDTGAETEDDEFERQETPPQLKRPQSTEEPKQQQQQQEKEDQETDDDSPPASPLPTRQKPPPKASKGLGVIGGTKRQPPKKPSLQPSPTPEPLTPATKSHPARSKHDIQTVPTNDDDDQTASGSDDDDLDDQPPPPPQGPKPKPAAKTRGLGIIGGKKKDTQPVPAPAETPVPEQSPETKRFKTQAPEGWPRPATGPKRVGKLGVIGGKASKSRADTAQPSKESLSPSPQVEGDVNSEGNTLGPKVEATKSTAPSPVKRETPKVQPEEPKEEETEQERADRKREELKRQLEAKAKAPAKKKRKF